MAGHAHRRRLIQFVASAFALGSIVWPSSLYAMDQPPPNKAAAPQQMTLPSASKSNEPISVTSFEFGSFRPNPIVLESMTIAEYLLVVELDGPVTRTELSRFLEPLSIVIDNGIGIPVTAPPAQVEFESLPASSSTAAAPVPRRAKVRGQITFMLKQGDVGGTILGANWGESHTAFLRGAAGQLTSLFVPVEIRSSGIRLATIIGIIGAMVIYFAVFAWFAWKRFRRTPQLPPDDVAAQPTTAGMSLPPPPGPQPPLPLPEVPRQLLAALSEGRAMLVLGAGASAQAGYPAEEELIGQLLRRLRERLPPGLAQSLETAIGMRGIGIEGMRNIGIGRLMDALASAVPREQIAAEIAHILDEVRADSAFHEKLAKLPWHGVLSLTWDNFAERIFTQARWQQGSEWLKFSLEEAAELPSAARGGQRLYLRPLGELSRPATVCLSMEEFRRNLARRPEFQRQLALLLQTHCFLFIGVGRNTLEQFMQAVGADLEVPEERHFVLIADNPEDSLLSVTLKRFGLQLLRYTADPEHSAVSRFVDALARSPLPRTARPANRHVSHNEFATSRIESVTLKNIGLFDEITLKFETAPIPPQETAAASTTPESSRKPTVPWTVIFGANGCGKSSILRAIGLAFCGAEAQGAAGRLLQVGKSEGSIEVQFGSQTLRTRLVRNRNDVLVSAGQVSPVQGGLALVLGFPALRGAPSGNPSGAAPIEAPLPEPADLLPMVKGEVDRRLGSFKQWLINVLEQAGRGERRAVALKSLLDGIIRDVVPGTIQKLAPLDNSYVIRVKTDDSDKPSPNDIPFDDLSQGMTSIFNWLGVLAQRMYDFYQDDDKPEAQSAVVMIDEIDAHLHPEWQRRMVELTKKFFPNVQVLATSHSPLLAGALRGKELCVLEADPSTRKVARLTVDIDTYGMRSQDIMLSPIFNMSSDRNPDLEQRIKRHVDLIQTLHPTKEQETELAKLTTELQNFNYAGAKPPPKMLIPSQEQIDALKQRLGSTAPDSVAPISGGGGRIS